MTIGKFVFAGLALAAAVSAVPATATVYAFNLTGGKTASFLIDNMTPPAFFSTSTLIGNQVSYDGVPGVFGGTAQSASIGFGTGLLAGFQIGGTSLGFTQYAGPDLFTLVGTLPVFNLGTFNLSSITSGQAQLAISQVSAAVPEPASWALMLIGSGAVGFAMRRKRTGAAATLA